MLCVIGCGNSTRCDDGAGVLVAQALQARLRQHPHPGVRVFDAGTGGMEVMFQARGAGKLIIVDASSSGSEAGAIFKVPGQELEQQAEPAYSLHDFRWQHALAAGRKIFGAAFPSDVTVYLIEAQCLGFGLELSPPVLAAAHQVIGYIQESISQYPRPEPASAGAALPASAPSSPAPAPAPAPAREISREISIAQGNLYLSRELCETYLRGAVSVALLAREQNVLIVPLTQQSGGGLLLKQRNARGDRVIHAQEFFRDQGFLEDFEERSAAVLWSSEAAALVVSGCPRIEAKA